MAKHVNDGSTQLVKSVYATSDDSHVREAMLLGALLEGGSWDGPWNVGDHGTSGGPYQIHWTVHPDVVAEAKKRGVTPAQLTSDPAYSVSWISPQYKAAVDKVPAALWQSDPEHAAEQAAYLAERPAKDYYATHGANAIHAAWGTTQKQLGSPDPGPPSSSGSGSQSTGAPTDTGTTGTDASTPTDSASDPGVAHIHIPIPIPGVPDISFDVPWLRISLFIIGAALLLLGVKMLFTGGGGGDGETKHVPIPVPV